MSKNTRNRILLTAIAALLLLAVTVGGTMAWLQDDTQTVTNTFQPNSISVDIAESDTDGDSNNMANEYEIIPGVNITKDPTVTFTSTVDAYIFIKETKDANWPAKMEYNLLDIWTLVPGQTDVYYTTVTGSDEADRVLGIIANNTITVPSTMENGDMPAAAVTLSYQAWAIQMVNGNGTTFTPEAAWAELNPTT